MYGRLVIPSSSIMNRCAVQVVCLRRAGGEARATKFGGSAGRVAGVARARARASNSSPRAPSRSGYLAGISMSWSELPVSCDYMRLHAIALASNGVHRAIMCGDHAANHMACTCDSRMVVSRVLETLKRSSAGIGRSATGIHHRARRIHAGAGRRGRGEAALMHRPFTPS